MTDTARLKKQRELALQDRLDDLLAGFDWWHEHKVAAMELSTLDEMLIRWMEHNQRRASE